MMTASECPICFETITVTNQTITECGHTFHTNCLMKNVMHNGFGCPYCRTKMCEEPEGHHDDDEEDSDYSVTNDDDMSEIETDDEEEIQDWLAHERIQRTEERAFANFRRLFGEDDYGENQLEQEDQDQQEEEYDDPDDESSDSDSDSLVEERIDSGRERPTTDYITQKLIQRGINMGHLVKLMLAGEYPLYDDIMTRRNYRRDMRNLHEQLRDIINNYDAQEEYDNDSGEEEQQHVQENIALD